MTLQHIPVLVDKVIEYLNPKKNEKFIDATFGLGGYSEKILARLGSKGSVLGIDWDRKNILEGQKRLEQFKNQLRIREGNFADIEKIARSEKYVSVSGIVLDLGLASTQITNPHYGLSFSGKKQVLDMRLDPEARFSAKDIINHYPEKKLADVFYQNADLGNSRSIARKIVEAREKKEIIYNQELVNLLGSKNPKFLAPVFQALRIEVNKELENLKKALPQAVSILKNGGRIVVVSYHSGEDRIVKNFFREQKHEGSLKILTKKPIIAEREEIIINPRSRSAKLRAAEKIC